MDKNKKFLIEWIDYGEVKVEARYFEIIDQFIVFYIFADSGTEMKKYLANGKLVKSVKLIEE